MKRIALTQGKFAVVDDDDFRWLNQWKWHAIKGRYTYYARTIEYLGGGRDNARYKRIRMHRLIMKARENQLVDHKDGNGLNNQRKNLRICSCSENNQNGKNYKNSLSRYRGVTWHRKTRKWQAEIGHNNKTIYLGLYKDERDAAKAYDHKARELFREFARTNF